ncbi:hypothetical protein ACN24K_30260 [Streptomyces microflavus]
MSSSRTASSPFAGLGLVQGAELAQRLELVGAGRDPHRFAQLGLTGGGRGVGGELGPDHGVGVRFVDGARSRFGEQPGDPLPRAELRRAALVTGQVLMPRVLPGVEPGGAQGGRDGGRVPLARRRTQRRPVRAGSAGSRGTATYGAVVRRPVRRGSSGVVIGGLAFQGGK